MKAYIFCFAILLLPIYSFKNIDTKKENTLSLEEAIKKNLIQIEVKGLGGYSGKCLEAKITNTGNKKITFKINPGTVFEPFDTTMQSIILNNGYIVELEKGQKKLQKLNGYCCIANNRSPSIGTSFKIGKAKSKELVDIASYLSTKKFNDDVNQSAIWCVSDKHKVSCVYDDDINKVKELRAEICKLTGQKDNWYCTNTNRTIDNRGYIQTAPVEVKGNMKINIEKASTLYQTIYKEDGDTIETNKKIFDVPGKGELNFKFVLRVKGWENGKYFVKIFMDKKEVMKQEFSI